MTIVTNNGAPITLPTGGKERITIPGGMSDVDSKILEHTLCRKLMDTKMPIMEPKGDEEDSTEYVQRMGYRLMVDGYTPAAEKKTPAKSAKKAAQPAESKAVVSADVNVTDAARDLAEEHGIDVAAIEGSGQGGRILKGDVDKAIKAKEAGE